MIETGIPVIENMVRLPEASNKCPARKFSALPHGRADFYNEEEICCKQPAADVESCKQDSN